MISFIFDFDSTLVRNESLNDALEITMGEDKDKKSEVEKITKMAMEGLISPQESMEKRLQLATLNKSIISRIAKDSASQISYGMKDLISYLNENSINVFIVSGGFKEIILPTAKILGIPEANIYANSFIYNDNGIVEGVEDSIVLETHGKVKQIKKLKEDGILNGRIVMVGDGYTDLETYIYGAVDDYICFCGVVTREKVVKESRIIAKNADDLDILVKQIINNEI